MIYFVRGILWLGKKRVGQAFLLALVSWIVLTQLWNLCKDGTPAFNVIAAIFRPGFEIGWYVARLVSANIVQTSLIELAAELLVYTVFWYAVIRIAKGMRTEMRIEEPDSK